ncbi:MAG TPA: L-lactate permease [Acetobacteraceae bacterium]|nr:L-lactate permease [Acetobacteraceae bacterium]
MFHQELTPLAGSLALSAAAAVLPVLTVLLLLGAWRRPAWQASAAGLLVGLALAVALWGFPARMALNAVLAGAVFALWPVMWIVTGALLLYNVAVASGRFDAFRDWMLHHLPNDRRVVLVVVGFSFGALLEGIAGFGSPIAITSSLLILTGWSALDALTYTLIFNTAPVAFGALGVPVTVLGKVTGLPAAVLGAAVGRQLPFLAVLLPFYVMAVFGGRRSVAALWPLLLTAGLSFAGAQFLVSNFGDYQLTDVFASLVSLAATVLFLQVWRPAPDPAYAMTASASARRASWQGWVPWIVVAAVVILWTHFAVPALGQVSIHWPGLDNRVFITQYHKPYALLYAFQPLASGTAVVLASVVTALMVGLPARSFFLCIRRTLAQVWLAALTVSLILGLAYLMNYAGLTYTLGAAAAALGIFFPLVSPFLGWVAVMLSGSDTSGNALFGNLQVVAAHQLSLNPVLFAATNSSGGVLGKMVSPQNISTGVAVTELKGQEGHVFARTLPHSIALTLLLGLLVLAQQYLFPAMLPR